MERPGPHGLPPLDPGRSPAVRLRAAEHDERRRGGPERAADERFRALVHHSFDAIVVSDADNVISYATPAIRTMFGHDPDALVGVNGFDFVHPDDLQMTQDELAAVGQGKPTVNFTNSYRTAHGSYRWLEWRSNPASGTSHGRSGSGW